MLKALRVMWRNTLARQFQTRVAADKGFRLVRSSMDKAQAWKVATSCFSFVSSVLGIGVLPCVLRVSAKADYLKQVAFSRGLLLLRE